MGRGRSGGGRAGLVSSARMAQVTPDQQIRRTLDGEVFITFGNPSNSAPERWGIEYSTPTRRLEQEYEEADTRRLVREIERMRFPNRVPEPALWAQQPMRTERQNSLVDLRDALRNHVADDNQVVRIKQNLQDGAWDWEINYRPFPPNYEP